MGGDLVDHHSFESVDIVLPIFGLVASSADKQSCD